MHRIEGKPLAANIRQEVAETVKQLPRTPTLAVLLVGDDPASHLYVKLKREAAEQAGIKVLVEEWTVAAMEQDMVQVVEKWNKDPQVDAILVQLPLPPSINETRVIEAMDPAKDVDGFHPDNVRRLLAGNGTIIPPLHEGILRLINEAPTRVNASRTVIIANSDTFAEPLRRLLTTAGSLVSYFQPDALDKRLLSEADIVIIAIGRPGFLKADMVKPNATIIDVGTTRMPDGKVRGDADLASFEPTDAWITPVPGGVGPMTVAQLLKNVVTLATKNVSS
jgi:methylenetetrahydrofolate dehydrogenase (NADP+)/methenyltetrahydrofolate cyclohydrolase